MCLSAVEWLSLFERITSSITVGITRNAARPILRYRVAASWAVGLLPFTMWDFEDTERGL